jgi:putative PIN family toxin of toxin-antitoxin system
MTVVFDTNVFVSAAASHTGSSRRCFSLLARRRFQLAVTAEILVEYETAALRLAQKPGKNLDLNWRPLFQWLAGRAVHVEPMPLGKQRSRDATDDIFLACALASGAKIIVSHDHDLLALEKPFGIEILRPSAFVACFKAA